jgi:type II secretory pathway component HofQ
MRSSLLLVAFACLIGCVREHETQERPPGNKPREPAVPTPLVMPDGAFADSRDGARRVNETSQAPPLSRFETRRIGGDERRGTRFAGALIDLDVKGADIHDVLRLVAEVGKVNIVVAGEVTGTITLKMKRVPWDQALDVIVRARGLTYEREGNVIMVTPISTKAAAVHGSP